MNNFSFRFRVSISDSVVYFGLEAFVVDVAVEVVVGIASLAVQILLVASSFVACDDSCCEAPNLNYRR